MLYYWLLCVFTGDLLAVIDNRLLLSTLERVAILVFSFCIMTMLSVVYNKLLKLS